MTSGSSNSRMFTRLTVAAMTVTPLLGVASTASTQTLFLQDFTGFDTVEPPPGPLLEIVPDQFVDLGVSADDPPAVLGGITDGVIDFDDRSGSDRAYFLLRETLPTAAFTISFDLLAPVIDLAPATNEVVLRVGTGTSDNSLQSAEAIAEAIVYRGGPRGQFQNNGNETIFRSSITRMPASRSIAPLTSPT